MSHCIIGIPCILFLQCYLTPLRKAIAENERSSFSVLQNYHKNPVIGQAPRYRCQFPKDENREAEAEWLPLLWQSICSHRGNTLFPRWELLESRKESVSIAVADAEKVVSGRRESRKVTLACLEIFVFIKKTSIPPVNGPEAPKIKDSLIFIPPLIPPVISPISLPPVISSGVERSLHALRLVEMTMGR